MFRSLLKIIERVVGAFRGASSKPAGSAEPQAEEAMQNQLVALVVDDEEHPPQGELEHFDVEEVNALSDWDGPIPARHSSLFPQSRPTAHPPSSRPSDKDPNSTVDPIAISHRDTPSAAQLFHEAEAQLNPQPPPSPPDRPLPKPVELHQESFIPQAGNPYNVHVQVGRVMKREEPPPPERPQIDFASRIPDSRASTGGKRRLIQPLAPGERAQRTSLDHAFASEPQRAWGASQSGEWGQAAQAYHDLGGERGATSRAQYSEVTPAQSGWGEDLNSVSSPHILSPRVSHVEFSGMRPASPPLKPKPIRFKKSNYLRFWGNYSAQPSYLHFGSLIRSERFIQLLPAWHDELDELEEEARSEWAHLDDQSPHEGEADWRRLLNPTMSSPVEFLLHRDRVEQLNLLPRGRHH